MINYTINQPQSLFYQENKPSSQHFYKEKEHISYTYQTYYKLN